jgi:hypothetical protein
MASAHHKNISELGTPKEQNSGHSSLSGDDDNERWRNESTLDIGQDLSEGRGGLKVKCSLDPMEQSHSIHDPHTKGGGVDLCVSASKICKST